MRVQGTVTPLYPRATSVTAMMMSSKEALAPCASPGCRETLGFGGIVDFVCSEAEQLHYRQCIILSSSKGQDFRKKKTKCLASLSIRKHKWHSAPPG